jgi:hypothetical protein
MRHCSAADPNRVELAAMSDSVLCSRRLSQPRIQASIDLQNVTNPNEPTEFVTRRRLSPNYAENLPPMAGIVTNCMLKAPHPSSIPPPRSLTVPSRRFSPLP